MITISIKDESIQIAQTLLKEIKEMSTKEKAQKATKTVGKALQKKAKVEVLPPDPFVEIAEKVNQLTEKTSVVEARQLAQDIDCNFFRLGGILARISDQEWWASAGFVSFKIFVQAELGMHYRKAMFLISIYNYLVEAGIPFEKVKNLGWTKLRELAPVINEDNIDEWVQTAENMNTLQLIEEIKESKKGDADVEEDKAPNDIKSKVFKLHADQREVIEEAIEAAKLKAGTEFDAVALEQICMEYLGTPSKKNEATAPKKVEKEKVTEEDLDDVMDDYEEVEEDIDPDHLLAQNEYEGQDDDSIADDSEFTEADGGEDLPYDDESDEDAETEEEINF